jgi:hypothetical protein
MRTHCHALSSPLHPPTRPSLHISHTNTQTMRKLMYRAKQRGWLELDLVVGLWAEENLPRMTPEMLADFDVSPACSIIL